MSEPVIHTENLGKRYRIGRQLPYKTFRETLMGLASVPFKRKNPDSENMIWALEDISFDIQQGEVIGIIGRNGAGKSTLLKILSRITKPTTGRARIRGRVGSLLEVGTGFHQELTGRENVYLNGAILGMRRAEIDRKFDEIVEFAEVEKFLDTPIKHFSSGMYVRLAFAVAAHLEPEILMVDEVLAVGDISFQKKSLGKMEGISKQGRTVLFVSHNMPSIQALCSRVLLLRSGILQMDGPADSVISKYLSEGLNLEAVEVDLKKHAGRSYSLEPALQKGWLLDKDGVKTNTFLMGESLTVGFRFESKRLVLNPGFGFGIEDENGKRIFTLDNYMAPSTGNTFISIRKGEAFLHIPNIQLLPGTYMISISFVEDQRLWVDYVEQALAFHVQPADVFGSGKIPQHSQGIIYVPGEVTVRQVDPEATLQES